MRSATLADARRLFADMMVAASGSVDPRLGRIVEAVPRENFLPPGPWTIVCNGKPVSTPTADPIHLYQNVLIALDAAKGINNGEPLLHAGLIGAAAPQGNEIVAHIGAGTGYYTALLAMLVLPGGWVTAYEIERPLAEAATRNLRPFENVTVVSQDATTTDLTPCDLIYVNAGVVAPPLGWLQALRPGGRLIFPWRPTARIGLAGLVTRKEGGFAFRPVAPAYFIGCVGAEAAGPDARAPDSAGAWQSQSLRLRSRETPDESATAIYEHVWFSRTPIG